MVTPLEDEEEYWASVVATDAQISDLNGEQHRGQLRMAYRLANRYQDRLRHVHGIGWHVWDSMRWKLDRDGAATRAVIDVVRHAYAELPGYDRDGQRELLADIHRAESATGVDGVLRLAGDLFPLAVSVDKLDADPYLFNCRNGTLDLRTGLLRDHNPGDLITKVAGAAYSGESVQRVAQFDRFLATVLPDEETRTFVARVFGHALLGTVKEHLMPVFVGTGQNGKSTLVDIVSAGFGDYAIAAEPDLLVERGSTHTTGQADLLGVRLAVCSETDEGRRLAAGTMKRLTGGDVIRARRMRQDNIEFAPSHSVVMVTNHRPKVSGDDPALWRRLRVVPFDVVVDNPDRNLKERLLLELSGVLSWLVAGYRDWHEHGLAEPASVTAATDNYRATSDDLGRFLDERCMTAERATVRARELFSAWADWCRVNGEQAGTEVAFAEAMSRRGLDKKRTSAGQQYVGLMLYAEDTEPP